MIIKTIEKIDYDFWLSIPDYENNRDVKKRLKKPHLNGVMLPTQLIVSCVEFMDGGKKSVCKIDGHSRTAAWESGLLEKPQNLWLVTYEVQSKEDRYKLYRSFDSREASETPSEQLFTAKLESAFTPSSDLGKSTWTAALKMVTGKKTVSEALAVHVPELKMIDSMGITLDATTKRMFPTGVKMAMLRTFQRDPGKSFHFWQSYTHLENEVVCAELEESIRISPSNAIGQVDVCFKAMSLFEEY